jgi:hypothetical protein
VSKRARRLLARSTEQDKRCRCVASSSSLGLKPCEQSQVETRSMPGCAVHQDERRSLKQDGGAWRAPQDKTPQQGVASVSTLRLRTKTPSVSPRETLPQRVNAGEQPRGRGRPCHGAHMPQGWSRRRAPAARPAYHRPQLGCLASCELLLHTLPNAAAHAATHAATREGGCAQLAWLRRWRPSWRRCAQAPARSASALPRG